MASRHDYGEVQVEKFFAMSLRGGLSFLLGLMFGLVSLALFSSVIPPNWGERLLLTALCVGIGTGIAVFASWFKPEASRNVIVIGFALAFGIAILGAFAGYTYAGIYDVEVRNDLLISRGSARSSAIWAFAIGGSTLLSTAFSGTYYGFRLWRYHEV